MQVEVNETNIILYNLVELTGNSAEDMLLAARRAELEGYVLTCQVPDDLLIDFNVFTHGIDVSPADPHLGNDDHGPYSDTEPLKPKGRVIGVQFDDGIHEVVEGEVVDEGERT